MDIINTLKRVFKKNIAIIIPAAIAVAALLLFVPTLMIKGKISDKLEESISMARQVESASRSAVSKQQPQIAKEYQDAHQQDANQIKQLAIETTQRELLSYKIFPAPEETSVQIFNEFQKAYLNSFVEMIESIGALDAPSDIEIRKEAGSDTSVSSNRTARRSRRTEENTADDKIVELICKRRSEKIPVYANPQALSGYGFWENWEYYGVENAVKDCWYCQLACWIQKDVIDTIKKINSGSKSVSTSSVKRLLGVRFASSDAFSDGIINATEMPVYALEDGGTLTTAWTKRITDENIDVMHFSLAVVVRADDVLKFIDALCSEKQHYFAGYKGQLDRQLFKHNQITVLQSSIESVDRKSVDHQRYRYGQDAVVKLNLVCEYIFYKQGYNEIKPETIKAITDETASKTSRSSRRRR